MIDFSANPELPACGKGLGSMLLSWAGDMRVGMKPTPTVIVVNASQGRGKLLRNALVEATDG